jgi:LysM repeat protein
MKPYLSIPTLATTLYLTLPALAEARDYKVKPNDTLEHIGHKTSLTVDDLLSCNHGIKPLKLQVGQKVHLSQTYTVKPDDSLWLIAEQKGTTPTEIAAYNRIKDVDIIHPGTVLELPCRKPRDKPTSRVEDHDEQYTPSTPKKKKKLAKARFVRFPSGLRLEVVTDLNLIGSGKEFYDPNQSGNPLLRVPRAALDDQVSRYFKLMEFAHIGTPSLARKEYMQTYAGDRYNTHIRLDLVLLKKLDQLRAQAGQQLFIRSGYRSYGYNDRLYRRIYGRRPTISRHSSGDGVDVDLPPMKKKQRRKFDQKVERIFRQGGVGRANGFAHVDDRGRKARWRY